VEASEQPIKMKKGSKEAKSEKTPNLANNHIL